MKLIGFGAKAALAMSVSLVAQQPPAHAGHHGIDGTKVTLTGCVVKGAGGYMLTNVTAAAAEQGMAGAHASATAAHASPEIAGRTFYYLKDDDKLEGHAGRRVEVVGEVEGEIERGTISVERENGMIELEFKVDGDKKMTVAVPELPASAVGTSGSVTDREQDHQFLVKTLEVEKVKKLADSCK